MSMLIGQASHFNSQLQHFYLNCTEPWCLCVCITSPPFFFLHIQNASPQVLDVIHYMCFYASFIFPRLDNVLRMSQFSGWVFHLGLLNFLQSNSISLTLEVRIVYMHIMIMNCMIMSHNFFWFNTPKQFVHHLKTYCLKGTISFFSYWVIYQTCKGWQINGHAERLYVICVCTCLHHVAIGCSEPLSSKSKSQCKEFSSVLRLCLYGWEWEHGLHAVNMNKLNGNFMFSSYCCLFSF